MTSAEEPLRVGILGAARIAELAIVKPAHATGTRLVTVAARDRPWNLAATEAGKHVLSEKPFASTAHEAAEVRTAAQKAGVTVVEGFHYLFHPVMQRLFALLDAGELGELHHVDALIAMPAPDDGDRAGRSTSPAVP